MHLIQILLSTPARLMGTIQGVVATPFRMVSGGLSRITTPLARLGLRLPTKPADSFRLWWDSLRPQQVHKRQRISERAQLSQIHLIQLSNDKRTVLHIGTHIGRKKAELALRQSNDRTITLQFALANAGDNNLPVQLTVLPSSTRVLVNGAAVNGVIHLKNRDTLTLGGERYLYELYAWDKAPIATRVDAGWATTNGSVRERNEDAIGIYQHPKGYLFAIADGVGSGQDGDMISAFAVQYLLAVFAKNILFDLSWQDILATGFQYINSEVRFFAQTALRPTGSTLTTMVIKNWEAHIAHVGDTRLYRFRNGILDQLTADHVNHLPVEMPTRVAFETTSPTPLHDVLTRAVGKRDTIQPDFLSVALQPGDRFILVTDGISKCLTVGDLSQAVQRGRPSQVAEHLVELANERTAIDNASVIVVEVLSEAFIDDSWKAVSNGRVFSGHRGWSLHLKRRQDPGTVVPLMSSGCVLVVIVITILALLGWALIGLFTRNASMTNLPSALMMFVQSIPPAQWLA